MSDIYNSRYTKMKNYELEDYFDLSKKKKEQLLASVDTKAKHKIKLQELYLRQPVEDNQILYLEAEEYIRYHEYILDREVIGYYYEFMTFITTNTLDKISIAFKTLEFYNSKYVLKFLLYTSLTNNEMLTAARLMSRVIDSEIELDNELAYYNLGVELNIEDDINGYLRLMEKFKDQIIAVNYLTIEFNFNYLIVKYFIEATNKQISEEQKLLIKKELNEQILKAISSGKNEDEIRAQVIHARDAIKAIDANPKCDIFKLITFNLLPKPTGIPEFSPFNKITS